MALLKCNVATKGTEAAVGICYNGSYAWPTMPTDNIITKMAFIPF
jgi:hypothetical protein